MNYPKVYSSKLFIISDVLKNLIHELELFLQ